MLEDEDTGGIVNEPSTDNAENHHSNRRTHTPVSPSPCPEGTGEAPE